MEAESA
jgi:subtilisin family serine protease